MPKRRLLAAAVAGFFVAAVLVALPIVARRLVIQRVAALTGRPVVITDVDLDLFARRIVFEDVRIGSPGASPAGRGPGPDGRVPADAAPSRARLPRPRGGHRARGASRETPRRPAQRRGRDRARATIEDGSVRFLDRAARPFYSEESRD